MGVGDFLKPLGLGGGEGGGLLGLVNIILIALGAMIIIGGILYFFYSKKQWNIKKVYFRLPREIDFVDTKPGQLNLDIKGMVRKEIGKGMYDSKRGVVFVKRKGKKKVALKPFQLAKFLDGDGNLEVIQVGSNEYVPVMPQSYLFYKDDKTNDICCFLNHRTDISESKAWRTSFEREAKSAFSIMGMLREYAPIIAIGLVIFLWGIQMLLLYTRIK
jgi:hypothetical protein